ncbi:hypothetical protein J4Q44_G00090480 [Coregonus suidteri]|uniref:Uncharacterized protein n=1 Tax=Coregonus suidteri TaxID=861788 RepID=A0AAN8R0T7_9TELE
MPEVNDESPSSSLPASAQHSNTHIEKTTEQEITGTSCLPSMPLNLPQQNSPQSVVAQDCAQSDCNIGTKKSEYKHKQPARDCVPVTEDALDPNCQETLPENGELDASPDGAHGDDVASPVGSQSQTSPIAMDTPQSERVHEGHCCISTVEEKLRPQHANEKDAEVMHNNPPTSKHPRVETDLPHSRQSDQLKVEEKTFDIDYALFASNKIYQLSFELTAEIRDIHSRNMQGIAIIQSTNDSRPTCQISPVSELKTKLSSGCQEPPSPFTIPIILKGKQNTRDPSVMTTSADSQKAHSIPTSHKRVHQGKWNTIRETFCEISRQKESRVHIPVSSALPNIPTPSTMDSSRLWQDYPRTNSSPCHPSFCFWCFSTQLTGQRGVRAI